MSVERMEALARNKARQVARFLPRDVGFALMIFRKGDAIAGGEIEYAVHSHCEDMTKALVDFLETWRPK